jgi:hypothetical protein
MAFCLKIDRGFLILPENVSGQAVFPQGKEAEKSVLMKNISGRNNLSSKVVKFSRKNYINYCKIRMYLILSPLIIL